MSRGVRPFRLITCRFTGLLGVEPSGTIRIQSGEERTGQVPSGTVCVPGA